MLKKWIAVALMAVSTVAFGHATVKTESGLGESLAGKSEIYRVNVPVEKDVPTTEVRLLVPAGVKISRFLQSPGWTRTVVKDANGTVTEVVWKGQVDPMEFVRFYFQATNPADAGTLTWKMYQTYGDGTVAKWDGSSAEEPASTTTVK